MNERTEIDYKGLTSEQLKAIDEMYSELCKELAEYKKCEENDLLLRLPCKVGDSVYRVHLDGEYTLVWWVYTKETFTLSFYEKYKDEFGKTVFLTEAAAEQALRQMGE